MCSCSALALIELRTQLKLRFFLLFTLIYLLFTCLCTFMKHIHSNRNTLIVLHKMFCVRWKIYTLPIYTVPFDSLFMNILHKLFETIDYSANLWWNFFSLSLSALPVCFVLRSWLTFAIFTLNWRSSFRRRQQSSPMQIGGWRAMRLKSRSYAWGWRS